MAVRSFKTLTEEYNMNVIETLKAAWGWVGIKPVEVVAENEFGNLIIKDEQDQFWRLCPEEVYCKVIADSIYEYNKLIQDDDFLNDWNMTVMVNEAIEMLGPLEQGYKYYMVIPGVLDGEYGGENFKTAPLIKIIEFSGNLGRQIKNMPDGAEIQLKVID